MMKGRLGRLALVLAWAAAAGAGHAAAEEIRIGFVDVPHVLDKAPQAERARARIQAEFAPIDQELLRLQREIRAEEERLVRDGAIMTAEERANLERAILSGKRDLRRRQEEFREDLNLRRNQELQQLQRQVLLAIQAMARSEGYDLVLNEGVLFAGKRVDLTAKVLERLVAEHGKTE